MKKCLTLIFLLLLCVPAHALEKRAKKNVLFLNSYQNGYDWSDKTIDGLRNVLRHSSMLLELHIEYMDTKRFNSPEYLENIKKHYALKYKDYTFSAIVVADNNALNFMVKNHDLLFPGVPVIFCGVNNYENITLPNSFQHITIKEDPDIRANIKIAQKLQPGLQKVIVLGDSSVTSTAIIAQINRVEPEFADSLNFEYWTDYSLPVLLRKVQSLKKDSIILFTPFYKGAEKEVYSAQEMLEIVSQNSPVMIFTVWEFLLDHGTIGGKLLSGTAQGRLAGEVTVNFLESGIFPKQGSLKSSGDRYMFDNNILKKFFINKSRLPEGSIIINAPKSFYKLNKRLFWTIIISIIILTFILIQLVISVLQRRKVEKRIKSQLSFQESLMNAIPLLIFWKDKNQNYLGANCAFTDFFGLKEPASIIGSNDQKLQLDASFARHAAAWDREVIESNSPRLRLNWSVIDKKGKPMWFETNNVPLYNEKQQVVGTLSTAQDITRRISLEKQLLQSQKMEAIGTLVGGISHDFNNILTSIMNSVELAITDVEADSLTWKDLDRARKAAYRGSRLVKQILSFSKLSQEGFKPTNITEVVQETVDFITASLPKNIAVECQLPEQVPIIMADPTQIHQIIMNLCTNSFQSLRSRGGKIKLSLCSVDLEEEQSQLLGLPTGRYLRLEIRDNGPGIPQDIINKIFDPFFTTKGKSEGTGLGLAVVHGLIKGHNGSISVVSSPNIKTCFEIHLPVRDIQQGSREKNHDLLPLGNEHILFVEDDQGQLETAPRLLETLGYQVTAVSSPKKAHDLVREANNNFHLVVSDYDMPEMNGVELAQAIAQVQPKLPVIIVSGRRNISEYADNEPNIIDIVLKPYSKKTLATAMRKAFTKGE